MFGTMEDMELLKLSDTGISGTLPPKMGEMTDLVDFSMIGTSLSGTVPDSVPRMDRLRHIFLGKSGLSGTVSAALGHMTKLKTLSMHSSMISGTVPQTLTKLTRLSQLALFGNKLSGSIPIDFVKLKELDECAIAGTTTPGAHDNSFDCPLPMVLPAACSAARAVCEAPGASNLALIGIIAPMAIIILVLLGVVAFQLNKRHQARKSKLLKEVTTTSQTVMSDLNKKKSTNGPTVVVDGKAMDPEGAGPDFSLNDAAVAAAGSCKTNGNKA